MIEGPPIRGKRGQTTLFATEMTKRQYLTLKPLRLSKGSQHPRNNKLRPLNNYDVTTADLKTAEHWRYILMCMKKKREKLPMENKVGI